MKVVRRKILVFYQPREELIALPGSYQLALLWPIDQSDP